MAINHLTDLASSKHYTVETFPNFIVFHVLLVVPSFSDVPTTELRNK